MKKINITDLPKTEKPDLKKIVADCVVDCPMCTQEQVYQIADSIWNRMDSYYSACMQRINNVVSQINEALEEHSEGHLPPMDRGQKIAVLDAAGIADQFVVPQVSVDPSAEYVWAKKATAEDKSLAQALKIEAK